MLNIITKHSILSFNDFKINSVMYELREYSGFHYKVKQNLAVITTENKFNSFLTSTKPHLC